jgi:MFS family permease
MTSYFLSNSLPLLELKPKYICTYPNGTDYSCKNNEFCGTNIPYRVNYTDDASLENWVEDLNMYCASDTQVGLLGSMYFSGWAFAALFIPRLSDIYGRRKIYLWTMTGHLLIYLGVILSRDLKLTTVL